MADRINSADTHGGVWDTALQFLPELGLSKVVFYDLSRGTDPLIMSNADQGWTDAHCATVSLGDDPFPINCLSRAAPVLTGVAHLGHHPYLDDDARNQVALGSQTLNIQTGMSVTIQPSCTGAGIGWNLMSSSTATEFAEMRAELEGEWRAWCQLTFASLLQASNTLPPQRLSIRERDCLALIADGLRTKAAAHHHGIAEATVEMHIRRARIRMGAKTRDQAIAMAVRGNLI
jgi:DNA-binding CsgD family transcriptional regulator